MAQETITRYVDITVVGSAGSWPKIKLYKDPEGKKETDGAISVKKDGAVIRFRRLPNRDIDWNFWNMTIHPLGVNVDEVDLQWSVTDSEAVLIDTTSAKKARTFSYTLAFQWISNGAKYYLDPRLVNTGGG